MLFCGNATKCKNENTGRPKGREIEQDHPQIAMPLREALGIERHCKQSAKVELTLNVGCLSPVSALPRNHFFESSIETRNNLGRHGPFFHMNVYITVIGPQ